MANSDGSKTGGRKPGTPNKRTGTLLDHLDALEYHPLHSLVFWAELAKGQYLEGKAEIEELLHKLENDAENGMAPSILNFYARKIEMLQNSNFDWAKIGSNCAAELIPYVFPKRKPVEGKERTPEQLSQMTQSELIDLAKQTISDLEQ